MNALDLAFTWIAWLLFGPTWGWLAAVRRYRRIVDGCYREVSE